ncbi:unnamed protein product [Rotaria magnacalcarata]|uniref:Uncharacterized protein n=3 Tax=Rotaria magnacalcarata TaxID=392030 RepID=A0A814PXF5_9BILA|nr:unnamed protein product [Rotaria magnacalcarata]CAF2030040.1 unnamed protein product [Rotaria magnacalcarata]CAF4000613.1 unnamed protein product [Rotaria magnacalcarata]
MRYLRSCRFLVILSFTIGISTFIYRLHSINRNLIVHSKNILSNKINKRLHLLRQQLSHVNFSMLLYRPSSNQSQSITYRCREWCGGWGDRLRGITSTFILAVITQRRFYIDMPYPCELTKFLIPNLYDWQLIEYDKSNRKTLYIKATVDKQLKQKMYEKISSTNFLIEWSQFDDISMETASDYVTPVLANKYLQNIVRLLNISSIESTQTRLFPLLYEILFRPTDHVMTMVDQLLIKLNNNKSVKKQLICLHIRIGKNPTMIYDEIRTYRDTMVEDMIQFVDKNLTINNNSMIFITSDSMKVNQDILDRYNTTNQSISIPGPIIHIDRLSSLYSSDERCTGFLKVISDFYVLGECDTLIMARSGFSEWASRRRYLIDQFNQLYLYCRGIYQVTGDQWRRPYNIC